MADTTCVLCEQGDLGLFAEPLSEADQQKYNKEQSKETEADE